MRIRAWLTIWLLLCSSAFASKEEGGGGLVYGPGHAFRIAAPMGWIFDNESGRNQGIHAAIYPVGQTWGGGSVVLYSGVTAKEQGSLDSVIDQDLARFQAANDKLTFKDMPALTTGDEREARVREFTGDRFGNTERVAYIDTPQVVCEIVMSARDPESYAKGVPALEEVVKSFRFLAVDSDEYIRSGKWKEDVK